MNELFEKLVQSKKYRDVCPDTVKRVLDECSLKYKRPKDIEKAAREKLHGITSAFMTESEYKRALKLAEDGDLENLLACHASTRERLPMEAMDEDYDRIFGVTGTPESVLDLACGMNPVYLRHRLPQSRIVGVDISGQSMAVIKAACDAEIRHGDLLCANSIPDARFDVALLFKILPLLDRQQAGSADGILKRINAKYIVASFPTRTLGGRNVGMAENYSRWMEEHMPANRTVAARLESDNELFYILKEK